jgi:hypothetical protein
MAFQFLSPLLPTYLAFSLVIAHRLPTGLAHIPFPIHSFTSTHSNAYNDRYQTSHPGRRVVPGYFSVLVWCNARWRPVR